MARIVQHYADKEKTIKDYPITLITAVYKNDGTNLEEVLSNIPTEEEKQTWNNKSDFDGDYNSLNNKPDLFDGDYNSLNNKPTIPTKASQINYEAKEGGTSVEVPMQNVIDSFNEYITYVATPFIESKGQSNGLATLGADNKIPSSQLPSSMPASDVADWAKAPEKPTYTANEVGALPNDTIIPTITDTYDSMSSNGMSGKAVASAISNKYMKPNDGIPKSDLDSLVRESLNKADSALQNHQDISGKEDIINKVSEWSSTTTDTHYPSEKLVKSELDKKGTYSKPSGGIPKTDLSNSVQTSLGKADTALQSYTEQYTGTITGISVNGTSVATSGVANITSVPASILSGAIPSGVSATTQAVGDNSTKIATTAFVTAAIDNLPEPMVFKGTLGTGGTITNLPAAASTNEGYTYKVITTGTYQGIAAKVGDTFISTGSKWELVPSGDEPSGTVTSVTINATSPISIDSNAAITTSGSRTISHAASGATAGSYGDSANQTPAYGGTFKVPYVTVNSTGHVTGISEHTVKIPASDNTNTTYTFAEGSTNGAFSVTPSGGSASSVKIHGLSTVATSGSYSDLSNKPNIIEDLDDLSDWAVITDVTVSSVTYHTYWKTAPTASNQVYGWAFHPTSGLLYYVYNNKGTYSAGNYNANTNTQMRIYKDETSTYPLIGSRTAASSITSGSTAVYGEISATNAITMTPSTGTITATTFNGTATNASKVNNLTVQTAVPANAKFTDTTYSVATVSANGLMSSTDKKMLSYASSAHFSKTGNKSGYLKININSTKSWMIAFTIRLYQGYKYYDIVCSGYNYGSNFWYSPSAILLGSSGESIEVKFGYDSANHLWVAVPDDNYTGADIFNVTNGYTQVDDPSGLFTITNVATSALTGTVQQTITAHRPLYKNEAPTFSLNGTTLTITTS